MIPASITFPLITISTVVVYFFALKKAPAVLARAAKAHPNGPLFVLVGMAFIAGGTFAWMLMQAWEFFT